MPHSCAPPTPPSLLRLPGSDQAWRRARVRMGAAVMKSAQRLLPGSMLRFLTLFCCSFLIWKNTRRRPLFVFFGFFLIQWFCYRLLFRHNHSVVVPSVAVDPCLNCKLAGSRHALKNNSKSQPVQSDGPAQFAILSLLISAGLGGKPT